MKKIIEFVKVGFKQRIVYRKSTFWGDRGRQGETGGDRGRFSVSF